MNLTDTQRIILSQASQRDDRLAIPPERLPAAARQTVAKSLLKLGLVTDEHASAYNVRDAWQVDGRTRLLRITDEGLRAIGVAPEGEDEPTTVGDTAPTGAEDAPAQETLAAPAEPAHGAPLAEEVVLLDQALATPRPKVNTTLRAAAQRVLDAWDDDANMRTDLPTAIDALRGTLTTKPGRPPREPGATRTPREGTKQEAVLGLLRRNEGATIAQICEATAWQPHSARGFLAALKKKGIEVTVLERVRKVGPDKVGCRGSYTIYSLTASLNQMREHT